MAFTNISAVWIIIAILTMVAPQAAPAGRELREDRGRPERPRGTTLNVSFLSRTQ